MGTMEGGMKKLLGMVGIIAATTVGTGEANKAVAQNTIDREKLEQYINKYGFQPNDGKVSTDYFDFIQKKLREEGLSLELASKYADAIMSPLVNHEPKPMLQADKNSFNSFTPEPKDFSLSSGNPDLANIAKYRLDKNLKPQKPFGYGEEDQN